jgi:outer membrane lipoprotein SlyB
MMKIMHMRKIPTVLTGIICLSLAACSTTDSDSASMANGMTSSPSSQQGTQQVDSQQNMSSTGTSSTASGYGLVQSIDVVPRALATGVGGSVAGAAVGGATSAATLSDKSYRINLRLDDGSSKTVMQDIQPSFQIGDRVRIDGDTVSPNN